MAGQNASLNVTFTSSGAGSVIGDAEAVQAALSGIHGGSVGVSYASKGASGAVGEARAFDQAMRAGTSSASDLGRAVGRAHQSTSGLGKEAQNARNHMRGVSDEMRAVASHAQSIGRAQLSAGASQLRQELTGSNRAMRELESGAGRASVAVRAAMPSSGSGGGAIKDAVIDMHKLADGTYGVAEGMKAIGAGGGAKPFSWAGQSAEYTQGGKEAQAGNEARKAKKAAESSGGTPWAPKAAADIDEVGNASSRAGGKVSGALVPSMSKLSNVGWTAMAALGAAAGVMSSATEHSSAMTKSTAGLGMSLDGMNSMLTRTEQTTARGLGGMNLSAQDSQLRQSARTMTQELAPAIRSSVGAVGAMETAKMGAWGALGPQIAGFANTVKSSAPGLQSMMTSLGSTALQLGSDTVAGLAASAPAWEGLANTVGANSPEITKAVTQMSRGLAEGGQAVSNTVAGAQGMGDTMLKNEDKLTGARRDPKTGAISSVGHWGDYDFFGTGAPKPGTPAAAGAAARDGVTPTGTSAPAPKPYTPSKDAAKYDGMSAKQIYSSQYHDATGVQPGQSLPHYGPKGPGSSTGGMPASIASGLGLSGGSAMPSLMSSMQSAVGGGSQLGQAAQQHITKAVHQAAPTASAGGASLGAAMTGGMVQGVTSTQTVTDTVMIKHAKRMIDVSSAALGVHSPSTEFDYLGRMTSAGYAQGVIRETHRAGSAVTGLFNQSKSGYGYQDGSAPLISMRKQSKTQVASGAQAQGAAAPPAGQKSQAIAYSSPLANANIDRHNARAQDLLSARAQRHQAAKDGWNVNPFAGDKPAGGGNDWLGKVKGLSDQFHQAGVASTMGFSKGMNSGTPQVVAAGSNMSGSLTKSFRKDLGISSPSTVFAGYGGDMAAGVPIGFSAGMPAATSEMSAATAAMSMALQGPLSDYGLQAGYTYVQAFADGSSREIKKADTQALGLPSNLSQNAMSNLAAGGFLRAGSGASTWKTNSGGNGVVTLGGAPSSLTVTVPGQDVVIGDQVVASIADRQIELMLNAATGTYDTL